MTGVEGLIKEAICLYGNRQIEAAKGKIWQAYLENMATGRQNLPIYEEDLNRAEVSIDDFMAFLRDTGILLR